MVPAPERDAVSAIASFGDRIPDSAVDTLMALAEPARGAATGLSEPLAQVLIQAYWALPARRGDLARVLIDMLRLPQPPDNLWGFVASLPAAARETLKPAVTDLGKENRWNAIRTLAIWGEATEEVQLAARQQCAALLRSPVGVPRAFHAFGTTEVITIQLLVCLLEAEDEIVVEAASLVQTVGRPGLAAHLYVATVAEPGEVPEALAPPTGEVLEQAEVDDSAVMAAGSRDVLAGEVARQLYSLATDTHGSAGERLLALQALRRLVEHLPKAHTSDLAPRLLQLHRQPSLSELDEWQIASTAPLSRVRIDTGAGKLAPLALVVAAEAFSAGRDPSEPCSEKEAQLARELFVAALPLLADEGNAVLGAMTVVAVASAAGELNAQVASLLVHPNEKVRARGAAHAALDAAISTQLVQDPSLAVRRAVAARAAALGQEARDRLAGDPDAGVRRVLERALETGGDVPPLA